MLEAAGGSIAYRFEARDVNLVLAPRSDGARSASPCALDGGPPGDAHGVDVDASGAGIALRAADVPARPPAGRGPPSAPSRSRSTARASRAYVFTFG